MGAPIVQLAMCTADLPGTVRRYVECFGFSDAGARMLWGERPAKVQDLGDDATCCLWWLVGSQDFFQLELFFHTRPAQRPVPSDRRPSDLGWVRWGLEVADFDGAVDRLRRSGVATIGEVGAVGGSRRVCFVDPDFGVVVEILERDDTLGDCRDGPAFVYATLSVPDLARARALFVDALELEEASPIHEPATEARWGLPGARRELLTVRGGQVLLELVAYETPSPRPLPQGHRLSDQGFMNIALGYRERTALEHDIDKAVGCGWTVNTPLPPQPVAATYLTDPDGVSLEMIAVPHGFETPYGFTARPPHPPLEPVT